MNNFWSTVECVVQIFEIQNFLLSEWFDMVVVDPYVPEFFRDGDVSILLEKKDSLHSFL
jgi:hypothetical protein